MMKWEVDVQENSNLKKLQMPDWEVILTKSINFEYTDDFSNVHSGLQFSLIFQRIKANRILHTYIPSIMLCIVTVFSGLIPADKTSEKVTICVTTFLSMIALFGAAKYDAFFIISIYLLRVKNISEDKPDSIQSPSPSMKIQIMVGKVCLRHKGKTLLGVVNKLFVSKSLLTTPSNISI